MLRPVSVFLLAGAARALTDIEHKPLYRKNMDPIVSPGKYVSHMHSFYGSDAVTKDLPVEGATDILQKGCPSGENINDMSVYCTFGRRSGHLCHADANCR
jgi:hypothetical protein